METEACTHAHSVLCGEPERHLFGDLQPRFNLVEPYPLDFADT